MKSKLIPLLVVLLALVSCTENYKTTPIVEKSFSDKFPNAQEVEWEKENDKEWEAEFKVNARSYSANFDLDGNWIETEYEIKSSEVPKIVLDSLKTNFKKYTIEQIELSETSSGAVYEFEIESNDSKLEVIINLQGIILKKETIND